MLGVIALAMPVRLMLPGFIAAAALAAIGGPLHDITMATLRQIALPRADLAAVVRAYMVMNQLGLLVVLLASPLLFRLFGVPQSVMLFGATIFAVG
jgi:hypothetical protein